MEIADPEREILRIRETENEGEASLSHPYPLSLSREICATAR